MEPIEEISADAIHAARRRLAKLIAVTPVTPAGPPNPPDRWLKLENLQPIGSFKLRGAGNAMLSADPNTLATGVYTASAGNMAQGVAWHARRLGIPCHVIVPDHAPDTKLRAVERMGGTVLRVSFDEWWRVMVEHRYPGLEGLFVHPVSNPDVIAGNGTIGLELLEQIPEVDAVVVPFGGGGLSCGIAAAIKSAKPDTRVFAAEVDTAAPLSASLAAGEPVGIEYVPTFVDGIGGKSVLPEMWPLIRRMLDGALVSSPTQIANAVRHLAERCHVVAEGAGAAALAAAWDRPDLGDRVVCIVSGGNIDRPVLANILMGEGPGV